LAIGDWRLAIAEQYAAEESAIRNPQSAIRDVTLMITPTHYMLLSAALFMIGVIGVMARRNIIIIFMSIELILNAVNINLIAFSLQLQNAIGQVFAVFVIAVAAAEAAVGLGIILAFYRNKETVNIDEMNLMRW
jgi:NADH-quinone oxidoreductase subunit K